ncbi:hypothetical protein Taro_053792 [Colocasia esculenta]|uniref:Uncharacterized protein n=1 Tax=Colocasia esculenta TaxID=4460 RepID=A0A843XM25_COLES|nr:hypothetical protein [Colocasia esculenta]
MEVQSRQRCHRRGDAVTTDQRDRRRSCSSGGARRLCFATVVRPDFPTFRPGGQCVSVTSWVSDVIVICVSTSVCVASLSRPVSPSHLRVAPDQRVTTAFCRVGRLTPVRVAGTGNPYRALFARLTPPYFLQLGARRRGSSVSDGLRKQLWRRVLLAAVRAECCVTRVVVGGCVLCQVLPTTEWVADWLVTTVRIFGSVGGDANFGGP